MEYQIFPFFFFFYRNDLQITSHYFHVPWWNTPQGRSEMSWNSFWNAVKKWDFEDNSTLFAKNHQVSASFLNFFLLWLVRTSCRSVWSVSVIIIKQIVLPLLRVTFCYFFHDSVQLSLSNMTTPYGIVLAWQLSKLLSVHKRLNYYSLKSTAYL